MNLTIEIDIWEDEDGAEVEVHYWGHPEEPSSAYSSGLTWKEALKDALEGIDVEPRLTIRDQGVATKGRGWERNWRGS